MRIICTQMALTRYVNAVQLCQVASIIAARCSSSGCTALCGRSLVTQPNRLGAHTMCVCRIKVRTCTRLIFQLFVRSNLIEKCKSKVEQSPHAYEWWVGRTGKLLQDRREVCIMKWNKELTAEADQITFLCSEPHQFSSLSTSLTFSEKD